MSRNRAYSSASTVSSGYGSEDRPSSANNTPRRKQKNNNHNNNGAQQQQQQQHHQYHEKQNVIVKAVSEILSFRQTKIVLFFIM